MKPAIKNFQERILKALSGRINDFYLAGGTALSLFYFQHRDSQDLDFFTHEFSKARIQEIVTLLSKELRKKPALIAEESRKNMAKVAIYSLHISKNEYMKVDFVQDWFGFIKEPRSINGIKVLSIPDIYIRKIYAIVGTFQVQDSIGRKVASGGRQEAKDLYDLYCLSNTYMRLSIFAYRYCQQTIREGIIRWFRTYDRFYMKTGLLELSLKKNIDYKDIELHFKKEVDKMLQKEIDFI